MVFYALFFLVGIGIAVPYTPDQIHDAMSVVAVLMAVALVASLLVPFAAFSQREKPHKYILMYAPMPLFGAYAVYVWHHPTIMHIVLMVCAMSMHLAYWTSGIHSRAFRREQFMLVFGNREGAQELVALIALLTGSGYAGIADGIVTPLLSGRQPGDVNWDSVPQQYKDYVPKARAAAVTWIVQMSSEEV